MWLPPRSESGIWATDVPEAKRRLSGTHYEGQYGNAPLTQSGQRYSLDTINRNPLRGNPPETVLYGVETDSALLTDPAFTARREAGSDINRPFLRGGRDPATLALEAVGATRVPAGEIAMCIWDAGAQRLEVTRPFRGRPKMFHVYKIPHRRVAAGATKHSWSFGNRVGS